MLGHAIEATDQVDKVPSPARRRRHLHVEIALAHAGGRHHKVSDGVDEAVRERDANPQGSQQEDKGQAEIHDGEGDLEHETVRCVLPVLGDVVIRQTHELEHFRIDWASHEQIGVVVAPQLHHRADEIG